MFSTSGRYKEYIRGLFSTSGRYSEHIGGCQYIGDTLSTLEDIVSTIRGFQYFGGYHEYIRRGEFDRASMGVGRVSAQLRVWAKEVKMY